MNYVLKKLPSKDASELRHNSQKSDKLGVSAISYFG